MTTAKMIKKTRRVRKRIALVLFAAVCAFLFVLGVWKIEEKQEHMAFVSRVTDLGFVLEDGTYLMREGNTVYELADKKLPFLKFGFYGQKINAAYKKDEEKFKIILSHGNGEYPFRINYGMDGDISGSITADDRLEYEKLSETDTDLIDKYREELYNIIHKMADYYKIAYDS